MEKKVQITCPAGIILSVIIVVGGQILKKFFLICKWCRKMVVWCVFIYVGRTNLKKEFVLIILVKKAIIISLQLGTCTIGKIW